MKNEFKARLISNILYGKLSELGCDTRIKEYADHILVGALKPNKNGFSAYKSGFGVVLWKICEGDMECQFAKMFEDGTYIGFNWNFEKEVVLIGEDNVPDSIDKIVDEIRDALV